MMHTLCQAAVRWFLPVAREQAPREACGFIINHGGHARVHVVPNAIIEPGAFAMNPDDAMDMLRRHQCLAVVHSHVGEDARPSLADMELAEALHMPHVIVCVDDGSVSITYPPGWSQPIVGREWVYGVSDCYTLLQDAMQEMGGITLPDFEREPWPTKTWNMFRPENFTKAGWVEVPLAEPFRALDVALFALDDDSPHCNHCGLVVEPAHLLHHAAGRLSTRELFSDFWRKHVRVHLRHQWRQ
jgi:proteasome lid subunit RPN8/RPN11